MIPRILNVSEVRRLLPSLLHALERHPDRVFRIAVRNRQVAELKAPPQVSKRGLAAARLLRLSTHRASKTSKPWRVSEDVDAHLY